MRITFYLPDDVTRRRVVTCLDDFGDYVHRLEEVIRRDPRHFPPDAGRRTAVIVCGPGWRATGFAVIATGAEDPDASLVLSSAAQNGIPPIASGPIAFALDYPSGAAITVPPIPESWLRISDADGEPPDIESLLDLVLDAG